MLSFALLLCAHAAVSYGDYDRSNHDNRSVRTPGQLDSSGCYYEGSWFAAGTAVSTRETCLSCTCGQGALSCRRRSCASAPEPPPHCHVVHRRGECCPELHCPDRVTYLDHTASSRSDDSYVDMPSSVVHACVEGGTVYAAGSAMSSSVACEQCFCLGGARRCVRPRCLPPPPGCTARPSPGACCPQRYYCEHGATKPPSETNSHDCITPNGNWVNEGGRVKESEGGSNCNHCFCLHGSIRCQHLACAPTLHGCKPLVQPGQCCAHQYICDYYKNGTKLQILNKERQNILQPLKEETRSFHTSKSTKRETNLKRLSSVTEKSTSAVTVIKEERLKSTAKVKRKTEEIQVTDTVALEEADTTKIMTTKVTQNKIDVTTSIITESTTEMTLDSDELTTEQPDGSVRIIINGTINCTAEISSTSMFLNVNDTNNTIWIQNEAQPRIPLLDKIENLDHTFSPNDIITEGHHNTNFDENETFTINVTTSLKTNSSRDPSTMSSTSLPKTILPALLGAVNISKTKKEEYDYDYTEPTLPPSLPNLKIIPFVAADAVVDDDTSSKEMPSYPSLTKEDKFPVYYPTKDTEETVFAMRKEDVYNLTHYSMFAPDKDEPRYPGIIQDGDPVKIGYPSITNDVRPDVHEYTVTASFGNPGQMNANINSEPNPVPKFEMESPAVNLFSPPAETEGGFVPKDPVLIDDYYSIYQSTPSGVIPHLTTSMPLNTKDECMSSDGRRVPDGESISFECSLCSCAWGELHCSPRTCHTPPGCKRQTTSVSTGDLCCGELVCDQDNKRTKVPISASNFKEIGNETIVTPLFKDKNRMNVTGQENPSFGGDASNKNVSLDVTNGVKNQMFEDTLFDTTTKPYVTNGAILNTTEKPKDPTLDSNHSTDYEEDEDDDGGFSLGSVLKLLLSETYDTTTVATKKRITTITHPPKVVTTTMAPTTVRKPSNTPDTFVPITHRYSYIPPKQSVQHYNTVDRIDHLVLGEASAIRKTSTQSPITYKPVTFTTMRRTYTTKTTQRPVSTKSVEINSKDGFISQSVEKRPTSNFLSGFGLGLPKLAGCNIYGRMYRVGRIIAELSSACQECKCTELGVQCRSLGC